MKKHPRTAHYQKQFEKTRKNKLRRIEKELLRNPNNTSAKKALEFWKTHDRKIK
jgi:hypothetical protein